MKMIGLKTYPSLWEVSDYGGMDKMKVERQQIHCLKKLKRWKELVAEDDKKKIDRETGKTAAETGRNNCQVSWRGKPNNDNEI